MRVENLQVIDITLSALSKLIQLLLLLSEGDAGDIGARTGAGALHTCSATITENKATTNIISGPRRNVIGINTHLLNMYYRRLVFLIFPM